MKENLFLPQVGVVQGKLPGVAHVEVVAHHGNHVEHDEAHDDHVKLLVGDDSKYNCLKLKALEAFQLKRNIAKTTATED